ncbi:C1q-related factor-like [Littorina saxatilis]|uniref:C1q domain-containing protein n=1 Tax=Littorina saxatilis TaxID=31220 RepID=A0AAN9BTM8_9CAEN
MMMKLYFALVLVGLAARSFAHPHHGQHAHEDEHVAFHAEADDQATYNAGDTVVFNTVLTNDGNEYDSSTGVFTAGNSGNYVFSVSMRVSGQTDSPRKLELFSQAQNKVIATAAGTESSSAFVVVALSVGDTVVVRSGVDGSTFDAGTTFSGFNLH